ncbi:MAG: bifunctional phosphopantothenoylcysteine decarboxylase/phosphopantothenate synthase [Planctomycetes bacterium]|nr:bifunctional phosphopantothenoylcysteine decarboxylase/phosphopantothenate synthase [Planctomycetota bacterium]
MEILVTAGNTQVPIDRVRCLTNVFTGRTGAAIALAAHGRGHGVTLLTSHPDTVRNASGVAVETYRTFDDLQDLMAQHIAPGKLNAVLHCAAVSDYHADGIFAPRAGTRFHNEDQTWHATAGAPALDDRSAGKVKSDEPELWLRLVRAPKLIDRIRSDWKFRGLLVKFKLEVGLSDEELLNVAEHSRSQSAADLMVANTLEGAADCAWLGPLDGAYQRIARPELPRRLLEEIEARHKEAMHG